MLHRHQLASMMRKNLREGDSWDDIAREVLKLTQNDANSIEPPNKETLGTLRVFLESRKSAAQAENDPIGVAMFDQWLDQLKRFERFIDRAVFVVGPFARMFEQLKNRAFEGTPLPPPADDRFAWGHNDVDLYWGDFREAYDLHTAGVLNVGNETSKLVDALQEARLQIAYMQGKFGETGTGNSVLAQIDRALKDVRDA